MIEIDGSTHSGSGTLLRYSAALSALTGTPIHMFHIRAKRDKPGLRPQHLHGLRACAHLCSGRLEGDEAGSQEIYFYPGSELLAGEFAWDIGTAGSTTMLAFCIAPIALYAPAASRFSVMGGLFQDFAPSAFHMQQVLFPLLARMGAEIEAEVIKPGYVPQGQGSIRIGVKPLQAPLRPLRMPDPGRVIGIGGISLASHLQEEKVAARMAEQSLKLLRDRGFESSIEVRNDLTAVQKGAALMLRAETDTGCLIGADQAGKRGRRSENIASFVVRSLVEDLASGATTDRHLADQLIIFAALAKGRSEYLAPSMTDHVYSNLWLVNKMLGAGTKIEGNRIKIDGIGFYRKSQLD